MDSALEGRAAKKNRALRIFAAGDAIDRKRNFYVPWSDLDLRLKDITDYSRWLLVTGPWQSGKTSFMHALADGAKNRGYHAVITTLSKEMVEAANNVSKHEMDAGSDFFAQLAARLESNSRGCLRRGSSRGMAGVLEMFQNLDRDVIWFIDEASMLNDIRRTGVIQTLLSELRACKQECISRNPAGSYYLRSFVLVGTPKLTQLIGDLRIERLVAAQAEYVSSNDLWDPEDPFGNSVSPLNLECAMVSEALKLEDIVTMLNEYSQEHAVKFHLEDSVRSSTEDEMTEVIRKLSKSILELTSGHKGMVGCCCEYLMRKSTETLKEWKQHVRIGHVSKVVFYSRAYSKVISNIAKYSSEAQEVILHCIETGGSTIVRDLFAVLGPLNDGVLVRMEQDRTVTLSSGLLLGALLEDCSFAKLEDLPTVHSFVEVIQTTFSYMNHGHLTRDEVLNANGQPSEYAWQYEFLLGLRFVMENSYSVSSRYTIMVEAKKRDKNGQRRTRLDVLLKNSGSQPKGFQLQGADAGTAGQNSIIKHIKKSEDYRLLHDCDMNYIYFQYGDYGVDAKAVIKEEAPKFKQLNYWVVHFFPDTKVWNIQQLHGSIWVSLRKSAVSSFPKFQFQRRRSV